MGHWAGTIVHVDGRAVVRPHRPTGYLSGMGDLTDGAVYVAGHRGLVGSAIVRRLERAGTRDIVTRTREELDLRDEGAVQRFFAAERPRHVYLAAARVGGILANSRYPVEFLTDNVKIAFNVITAAHEHGVEKLLFLGSSCIYPREAPQPMKEEHLLTGKLEPTNEAYAIAKIAGLKLCQAYRREYGDDFVTVMPSNVYGPGDSFHPENAHVLPALLRRFHEAKVAGEPEVVVWGTGRPRREFLHADDLADACVFVMERYSGEAPINVGVGDDQTIAELAELIAGVVGYEGAVRFDPSKPDGMERKLLDTGRLEALGWAPSIPLGEGIRSTYRWYLEKDVAETATAPS